MSDSARPRGTDAAAPSGRMAEGIVPALLKDIYLGRRTGRLSFVHGWERRSVRFIDGDVVQADTNAPGGHLGDLLVRHGLLEREDLSRALSVARRLGRSLGTVLTEERLIEKSLLEDALELHVCDTLVRVFGWREGSFEFEPQRAEEFKGYDLTLQVSTGDLILRAAASVVDPDVVRYCLRDLDQVPTLSTDPLLRFQRVTLQPIDAFVLSRVDGQLRAREIVSLAPVTSELAERSLLGLYCIGMIEYAPLGAAEAAVPAEALRREIEVASRTQHRRDHFEVLGVARDASGDRLREAYDRLARRYHPDLHRQPGLSDLKGSIDAVFARVAEAYTVLEDPRRRAAYEHALRLHAPVRSEVEPETGALPDAAPEQQRAQELLAVAEAHFAAARYWDALQQCEDLLPLARGHTRRRSRVLLAECTLKNPLWRKQAEEELLAALQEDAENADACLLLGRIYTNEGLPARASAMFRRVLELRPRHAAAAAELASLPEAPADTGLLKKLGLRSP